jgi:hypothetical protein
MMQCTGCQSYKAGIARVLGCIADSLQEGRLTSISTTDYKNTKASIFRLEVVGIAMAHIVVV